jgi:SAM-dependent methyltransferase
MNERKPVALHCRACPVCGESVNSLIKCVPADPWYRQRYAIDTASIVRCGKCGMMYTNPVLDDEINDSLYVSSDGYASEAETISSATDLFWEDQEVCLVEILAQQEAVSGRILDFGCGNGGLVYLGQRAGLDIHGIDLDERRIGLAKRYGVRNVEVSFSSTLEDACFDAVCCLHVLEHLKDCRSVVAEFDRLLRPGGLLFVAVPNVSAVSFLLGRKTYWGNPYEHRNGFDRRSLDQLLSGTTLRSISLAGRYAGIRKSIGVKASISMVVTKLTANCWGYYPTKLHRVYRKLLD